MIPDRIRRKCVYQTIHQLHEEKGYSLSALCAIAGIPRCSYYKWKNRKESAANHENAAILEEMVRLYTEVKGIYGYRRMTLNMRSRFKKGYNHKRIY